MKISLANLIIISVVAIIGFTLFMPQTMLSPGHLIEGHAKIDNDCFSCHTLFSGTPNQKCIECHTLKSIGIATTKGDPLQNKKLIPFHQALTKNDCTACHIDHQEDKTKRINRKFSHELLATSIKNNCLSCHQKPKDTLHKQLDSSCIQCHTLQKWKPAIFEHNKYFTLDKDHYASCATCHPQNNFKQYTCYGCHEHTETKIKQEHVEEGIAKFDNCVKCHRNANKDDTENLMRSKLEKSKDSD